MKTLEIHEDNIVTIKKWEFFNWYHVKSKKALGNWLYECEVEFWVTGYRNTYSC